MDIDDAAGACENAAGLGGEDGYEAKRTLDEQQLEEMNAVMGEAMEGRKDVTIAHYEGSRYQLLIGRIHYYNELSQKLHIVDHFQQAHYIKLSDIADVRIMEG